MKKTGQFVSGTLLYAITAIIIVLLTVFGFKFMKSLQQQRCETELLMFKTDLAESVDSISHKYGVVEDKSYGSLCSVDEVYFLDVNKIQEFDIPEINNLLSSNSGENVFLLKDEKIVDAFRADNFDIAYPNYQCIVTSKGKLRFHLESTGSGVDVKNIYNFTGCSPVVISLSQEETTGIILDISGKENKNRERYEEKYNNTDVNTHCKIMQGGRGFKIHIKNKLKDYANVSVYHKLPACLLNALGDEAADIINDVNIPGNLDYTNEYYGGLNMVKWLFDYIQSNGNINIMFKDLEFKDDFNLNNICEGNICSYLNVTVIANSTCNHPPPDCKAGYTCHSDGSCK